MTIDMQKQIFMDNLIRLLDERNVSQAEVARAIGVSPQTFNTWCRGVAIPRMGKIQKLADYFHIDKSYLVDSYNHNADALTPSNLSSPAAYPVPILGTICAGDGRICEENFDGYFFIDHSVKADYCLHVVGDSMIDAEIYDGDIVFILKDYIYEDGKIYAVVIKDENEAVLKRLYLENDKLILSPCNSDYRPVFADPEDVFIVGECVGVYRSV